MITQICALPTCDNFITGSKPFKLGSYPGEYCCHECVNDAFMLKKAGKPFQKSGVTAKTVKEPIAEPNVPHVLTTDFGDASIIRRFCDNTACKNPGKNPTFDIDGRIMTMITMCWKGRNGEFCSNDCLKTEKKYTEKETIKMPEENDSPISAGTTAPKKGGKKAVAKKAVAKKAVAKKAAGKTAVAAKAAPATSAVGRSKYANDATIVVKNTEHEYKGKRAEALAALLKNQTIEKFKEALAKKEAAGSDRLTTYSGWAINTAVEAGLIAVK